MLQDFIRQVRRNCQLASGAQAGLFSLCGLLLRLRQLYKWEHDLLPWQEPESAAVLEWIATQERAWEAQGDLSWHCLQWNGCSLDPFAIEDINPLKTSTPSWNRKALSMERGSAGGWPLLSFWGNWPKCGGMATSPS
ncbi:MAG: hypothetical protein JRI59_10970 [Deltaproteobacteria bacterium]|nr:hypothetical protein [Deltaproteobacteria bacterium]